MVLNPAPTRQNNNVVAGKVWSEGALGVVTGTEATQGTSQTAVGTTEYTHNTTLIENTISKRQRI